MYPDRDLAHRRPRTAFRIDRRSALRPDGAVASSGGQPRLVVTFVFRTADFSGIARSLPVQADRGPRDTCARPSVPSAGRNLLFDNRKVPLAPDPLASKSSR